MTPVTAAAPAVAQLRTEQAALERERRTLAALVEAAGMRASFDHRDRFRTMADNPLAGLAMYYDGEVVGLPGVTHVRDAAARLDQVDARLHEIAEELPAAEQREADESEQAQRAAEQRSREHVEQRMTMAREAAAVAAAADADYTSARGALHALIAGGPLGKLIRNHMALRAAAFRFRAAIGSKGDDEACRIADELGHDAIAARRALHLLPGSTHAAALPPTAQDDSEYGWLIDLLLNLPALQHTVTDLNVKVASMEAQR